jgi:prepilin-type N-terminal cleavage/methylation domain-containing protein
MNPRGGFTLIEVLISVAVIVIIGAIGISSLYNARDSKNLDAVADGLDAVLEQAKSDAIAGKSAASYGVWFDSGSYAYFQGSAYSAGAGTNKVTILPGGWKLSTTTSSGRSYIVFTHLTGAAQATGTVTVSKIADPSLARSISIGSAGDITVIR